MRSKFKFLSGAALCLSGLASAQSTQTCPTGATNCTISVQDAGHNSLNATADNSTTTSSIAGTSTASNQSGNTVAPVFDNSLQTTQNATTTTGTISSASNGNMSTNDNGSSATNGNQSLGQSNTGSSTNTLATGASTATNGAINSSTGASTSSTGASNAYLGGNTQSNGSASAVGNTTSSSGGSLGSDASNSGGNSETVVDASDRSRYKSIFIPAVIPGTPPSQLAVGNIIKETSACGPLQRIVRVPVSGTFIGLFRNASVPQGYTDDLEPVTDQAGNRMDYRLVRTPDGDTRMFGSQVVMFTTVIGVASNRNIALGGGSGGGSWGQGGIGSSSSNQRMVTSIQLRDCEIGTMHTVLVEVPPKAIRR